MNRSACFGLLLLGLLVAGCKEAPVSASDLAGPKSQELIVLVDLSASRSQEMKADARSFLHDEVNKLSFGDNLVLLEVQQSGLHDHPRQSIIKMPVLRDPGFISARDESYLHAAQNGAVIAVDSFFKPQAG